MLDMPMDVTDRPMREASEAHVALSLILDVSGSMHGNPINQLNNAVNNMVEQMKADDRLKNIVDLAVFVFGTYGREHIYQGFRAINDVGFIKLEAMDKSTYVVSAINKALDITKRRCAAYDKAGGSYKPWIILMTDGEFHDANEELETLSVKMRQRESEGKHNFFGIGIDGYKRSQMEGFTNKSACVIDIETASFTEFFSWVGRSIKAVSTKAPGSSVSLPALTFNVQS